MLTGKQRAMLRKEANGVPALYQIGKDGITENILKQFDEALGARELIMIHILESALLETRDTADELARLLKAEPVQSIGSKVVLYRQSEKNPRITL